MKSFLKFMMFVIIAIVLVGTSVYLIDESKIIDTEKDNNVVNNSGDAMIDVPSVNDNSGELSGDEELVNSGDTSGEVLESGENNDVVISGEQLSGEVMEDEVTNTLSDISGDVTSGENLEASETIM